MPRCPALVLVQVERRSLATTHNKVSAVSSTTG
jgi:hypothetical protein